MAQLFFQNMYTASIQVAVLAILIFIGYVCDKKGLFTEKASRLCNDLLFYIVTPAIICKAFLSVEKNPQNLKTLGLSLLCGVILHAVGIVLTLPFFRKMPKSQSCIFKFASIYGNVGYMALPLASAILGDKGVFFCSGIVVAFNVFSFTHGIWLMAVGEKDAKLDIKKILINPGTVSILIGTPLFLLGIKLPVIIDSPLQHIANLNTPMAMLMFGTYLSNSDLKTMFREKNSYITALLKLVVLPCVMIVGGRLCGITGDTLTALAISASAPTANATIMFAAKYNKDTGMASKTASLASVFSILTIPTMIAFAQTIG